jgi:hypothetical protein
MATILPHRSVSEMPGNGQAAWAAEVRGATLFRHSGG